MLAIAAGESAEFSRLLDTSPDLVRARASAPVDATLLHCTAFNGLDELCHTAPRATPDLARRLLARGAEVDAVVAQDPHATTLCWNLSSWFTHAGGVQLPLVDACLDAGAAIEGVAADGAPLGHAIGFGYTRAVEHLAARGASVAHLPAAAALGDVERIAQWMHPDGSFAPEAARFTRGPKPVTGRFSWPPPAEPDLAALALVTAATHGRDELVRWLLEGGVPADASVCLGQTPLHFAAYVGHPRVVELLLEAGAATDVRERQFGRTPAEWAEETDEHELASQIRAAS